MKDCVNSLDVWRALCKKKKIEADILFSISRMETNSQLHHDLILPSDEGVEDSLVDIEGLLSSRHKQLLIKVSIVREVVSFQRKCEPFP